jgi:hypothetical protein
MSILTIAINDPSLKKKSAEVAFCAQAVAVAMTEFQRGNGTVTAGNIVGMSGAGAANTSLGTWTYTPTATSP